MDYTVIVGPKKKARIILGPAPADECGPPRYTHAVTSATEWEVGQIDATYATMENGIVVGLVHNRSKHLAFVRFFKDGEFVANPLSNADE